VVYAAGFPTGVKRVPTRAFVGVDGGEGANVIAHERNRVTFVANDEGERAAVALAHDDNALALAGEVGFQAAVLAVLFPVFRLVVAAEVGAIDLNNAVELAGAVLKRHGFPQLVREDERRLVLNVQYFRRMECMMPDSEWEAKVKGLFKGELKRRGVSYNQLVEKLAAVGVTETEPNIRNKLARGKFTAIFLVQVLEAIGATSLPLD
jgi:Domain of unknown function (DUF6471)